MNLSIFSEQYVGRFYVSVDHIFCSHCEVTQNSFLKYFEGLGGFKRFLDSLAIFHQLRYACFAEFGDNCQMGLGLDDFFELYDVFGV